MTGCFTSQSKVWQAQGMIHRMPELAEQSIDRSSKQPSSNNTQISLEKIQQQQQQQHEQQQQQQQHEQQTETDPQQQKQQKQP